MLKQRWKSTSWWYNLQWLQKSCSHTYCWWKKSCTSWQIVYPIIFKVLYIPGGCLEFRPSTIWYVVFFLCRNPSSFQHVPPENVQKVKLKAFDQFGSFQGLITFWYKGSTATVVAPKSSRTEEPGLQISSTPFFQHIMKHWLVLSLSPQAKKKVY